VTEAAIEPVPAPAVATPPEPVERCSDRFRASACAFFPAGIVAAVLTVFVGAGPSVFAATYLTTACAAVIMFPIARWTTVSILTESPVRPAGRPVAFLARGRTAFAALTEMAVASAIAVGIGVVLDRATGTPVWPAFLAPVLLGFAFLTVWQGYWTEVVEARRGGILVRPAGVMSRRTNAELLLPDAAVDG
jgi:hypothetical protein